MDWTVGYLEKDGIVFSKVSGVMNWDQHKKWCQEAVLLARGHNSHKFLNDLRDMVPNFTVLEIDNLPRILREAGAEPGDKIAALYDTSSPHSSEFTFFKNTSFLEQIKVQYFTDKDKAIAWLKAD
jgi:hypothetical protein